MKYGIMGGFIRLAFAKTAFGYIEKVLPEVDAVSYRKRIRSPRKKCGNIRTRPGCGKALFPAAHEEDRSVRIQKGSGTGWRYTWHRDDPKNEFQFECNECIYQKNLGRRGLLKLGAMCCQADIINYGSLPYTDFIRTKTLCRGGVRCDFRFVRHRTDAGDGWERTKSV